MLPINKEVTLYRKPLAPYKNETGAYIDSDSDNIPDAVESLLSNNSTFLKFARMFADPDSAYYNKSLWENYSWCIAYFYSIALDKSFSEIKQNIDTNPIHWIPEYETELKSLPNSAEVKNRTENATQWLRDEFNPIIVESMSPVITQFIAVTDVGCFYAYTKVTVELRDPSGIGEIILKSQPEKDVPLIYDFRVFDANGSKIWSVSNLKLNITAGSSLWHYYVVCNATDLLNNTVEWNKEIKGIVKLIVDTVAKALSMLWGVLCEVGGKIAEALNFILEWIIDQIKGLLRAPMETLSSLLNSLSMTMLSAYEKYAPSESRGDGQESDKISPSDAKRLLEESGLTNLLKIIGITVGILYVAMTVIMLLTAGIGGIILWTAMSIIIYLIIQAIVGTFKEGELGVVGEILNTMVSAAISTITEMIKVTVGVIKAMCDYLGAPYRPTLTGYWLSALSFFAGGLGFLLGAGKIAAGLVGTIFSVMSIVLSGVLMVILTKMASPQFQVSRAAVYGIGLTAIFCGIIGIIYSIKALKTIAIPSERLLGWISTGISIVAVAMAMASLLI